MGRKLVLYTAVSLDGYIARKDDSLEWLFNSETEGQDMGYDEFYETIETILMGRKTYDQILIHEPDKPHMRGSNVTFSPGQSAVWRTMQNS